MTQRREQGRQGGDGASDADLAQHLGLLDWEALDPIARAAEGQPGDLGFFLGDELLEANEQGSDDGTQASDDDDAGSPAEDENQQPMRGGSSSSYERAVAPVVTTGHPSGQGGTHGGSGVASVTTGAMAASGRGTKRTRAAPTPKGGSSASQSSGSDGQAARTSTEPTDPSGSGDSRRKRKKPAPDLTAIEDPAERRKQRRLAKNRATAAVSRERKRVQMVQLAARTRALEQENANLQFMLGLRDSEIGRLRTELASPPRGAGVAEGNPVGDADAVATSPTEPAALTGVALPLAATLQQLCLRASRRSRGSLAALSCILYFLALTHVGSPPGAPHPFWAPVSPSLSQDPSGQCTLDWGAPMAWGWPFLLRLAAARRRRLQALRRATTALPPATGWDHGAWSQTLRQPSQQPQLPGSCWAPAALPARLPSWGDLGGLAIPAADPPPGWEVAALLLGPPGSPSRRASWDVLPILAPCPEPPLLLEELPSSGHSSNSSCNEVHINLETPSPCATSSISSGSSREAQPSQQTQGPLLRLPAGAGRGSDSSRIGAPATSPACGGPAAAARADAQRSALSRGAQKRRTAKEAAAKLSTTRVELPKAARRDYHMVARGLPALPPVPLSRRERARRSAMALLPLGMALLAAQSWVEERLYSAEICHSVIMG